MCWGLHNDAQVYRNLMLLRHYTGDVSELSLTFTATVSMYGQVSGDCLVRPAWLDQHVYPWTNVLTGHTYDAGFCHAL